jgi:hypothetical protein
MKIVLTHEAKKNSEPPKAAGRQAIKSTPIKIIPTIDLSVLAYVLPYPGNIVKHKLFWWFLTLTKIINCFLKVSFENLPPIYV